jgi:hypothetical protein
MNEMMGMLSTKYLGKMMHRDTFPLVILLFNDRAFDRFIRWSLDLVVVDDTHDIVWI